MHNEVLFDLLIARHGVNSPNTYLRVSDTIDYILGTKGVKNTMEKYGMLSFNEGILSDNRALWIDLNLNHLAQHFPDIYNRPPTMTAKNKNGPQI